MRPLGDGPGTEAEDEIPRPGDFLDQRCECLGIFERVDMAAVFTQAANQGFFINARDRLFTRGINISDNHFVSITKAITELVKQS